MDHHARHRRPGWAALPALILSTLLPLAMPGTAAAQEAGDPATGGRIAAVWCANCHAVAAGAGPAQANDAAPTFPAIAQRAATTSMALRAFLQTPHAAMPNYQLSHDELDDVVAYLLSLRRR
jgi:mono/diheme cytochrome c family protein